MTRRRSRSRAGLWRWTPNGIEPDRATANPLLVDCPACHATIGQHCSNRGRRRRDAHPARSEVAEDQQTRRKEPTGARASHDE